MYVCMYLCRCVGMHRYIDACRCAGLCVCFCWCLCVSVCSCVSCVLRVRVSFICGNRSINGTDMERLSERSLRNGSKKGGEMVCSGTRPTLGVQRKNQRLPPTGVAIGPRCPGGPLRNGLSPNWNDPVTVMRRGSTVTDRVQIGVAVVPLSTVSVCSRAAQFLSWRASFSWSFDPRTNWV